MYKIFRTDISSEKRNLIMEEINFYLGLGIENKKTPTYTDKNKSEFKDI